VGAGDAGLRLLADLAAGASRTALELVDTHTYPSGMVTLTYRVPGARGGPA